MIIANPIYDSVFKYLMEDPKAASLLISAIIDEEIQELEMRPQEMSAPSPKFGLTVFRVDFKALIKTEDGGSKQVLIELQKSKKPDDIQRFRKYLGDSYAKDEGKDSLPILTIYFLGYPLDTAHAGIHVKREYHDLLAGGALPEDTPKDHFIERLSHDCYVIQVSLLHDYTRSRLDRLLSIFNQQFLVKDSEQRRILNVPDDLSDGGTEVDYLLQRLNKAAASEKVQKLMDVEETFDLQMEKHLRDSAEQTEQERRLKEAALAREAEERRQKEEAKAREEEERRQKEEARAREKEERRQKEEERRQKEEALEALRQTARLLKSQGLPIAAIAQATKLSEEEIDKL